MAAALAGGGTAVRIEGATARGYLVRDRSGGATLVVTDVRSLPVDRLYEMWLIDGGGQAAPAGTFRPGAGVVVARLQAPISASASRFAITVEARPVDRPTTQPVLVADLAS